MFNFGIESLNQIDFTNDSLSLICFKNDINMNIWNNLCARNQFVFQIYESPTRPLLSDATVKSIKSSASISSFPTIIIHPTKLGSLNNNPYRRQLKDYFSSTPKQYDPFIILSNEYPTISTISYLRDLKFIFNKSIMVWIPYHNGKHDREIIEQCDNIIQFNEKFDVGIIKTRYQEHVKENLIKSINFTKVSDVSKQQYEKLCSFINGKNLKSKVDKTCNFDIDSCLNEALKSINIQVTDEYFEILKRSILNYLCIN